MGSIGGVLVLPCVRGAKISQTGRSAYQQGSDRGEYGGDEKRLVDE